MKNIKFVNDYSSQIYAGIKGSIKPLMLLFLSAYSTLSFAVVDFDVSEEALKDPKKWSGYVSTSYTRNVYDAESYHSYESYSFSGRVSYKESWGSLLLTVGGEQETLHGKESSYYNPFFEYRTPSYKWTDSISFKGSAGIYLPGSRTSKKDNFEYASRLAGYIFWSPLDELSFYVSPRLKFNSYQYKTAGGRVLIEKQFDVLMDAYWAITPEIYLELNGRIRHSKNYYGRTMDNTFTFLQELGWEFQPDWVAAIGHNNSGRFYDPEIGAAQGFEVYDKRSSTFYLSLTKYL